MLDKCYRIWLSAIRSLILIHIEYWFTQAGRPYDWIINHCTESDTGRNLFKLAIYIEFCLFIFQSNREPPTEFDRVTIFSFEDIRKDICKIRLLWCIIEISASTLKFPVVLDSVVKLQVTLESDTGMGFGTKHSSMNFTLFITLSPIDRSFSLVNDHLLYFCLMLS